MESLADGGRAAVLREARPEELDQVGELTLAAYVESGLISSGGYAEQLRDARSRAEQAELIVAVEPATDALLGTVTFCLPGTPYAEVSGPGEAEFRMLAVAGAARGRGVARALVGECVARARRRGARRLLLCTQPRNAPSIALYERLGFLTVPERDWEPVPGLPLVAYALDLAG